MTKSKTIERKQTVRFIEERLNELSDTLVNKYDQAQNTLEEAQRISDEMQQLAKVYETLTGNEAPKRGFKNVRDLIKIIGPLGRKPTSGPNATIGDAIEDILKEFMRPLTRHDLIEFLRERNVRLSLRNPRNVIANALRQDKQKRFLALKDGKVTLTEWKEKADAKS